MAEHQFEGPIKGYIVNTMSRNLWKVQGTMTADDYMQDGYEVFARCARHYPDVEPKHFMALFKTAWTRHIIDVAALDSEHKRLVSTTVIDGEQRVTLDPMGATDNDGYLSVMIKQAPSEVSQVLALFLNAPTELLELAMSSWRKSGQYKAGGNKQVSQWLGLPPGSTPLDTVQKYFGSDI